MKRKLYTILTMMLVLFSGVLLSACGNKYENMSFVIYYAYSEDATEWIKAEDNNVEIYYGETGDNATLNFDKGIASIYFKIEVKNVEAKHIGLITVSPPQSSGALIFSSKNVKQKEVFEVKISDSLKTSLSVFENNSGKSTKINLLVSDTLKKLNVKDNVNPAMVMSANNAMVLAGLDNIDYISTGGNVTYQLGAKYSLESAGWYDNAGVYTSTKDKGMLDEYFEIDDTGILRVKKTDGFLTDKSYILRIKANSIYKEDISTTFDIYLVEPASTTKTIDVKYDNGNVITDSIINLYQNSANYGSVSVVVDTSKIDSIYTTAVPIGNNKTVKYDIVVLIDGVEYNLSAPNEYNGLVVERLIDNGNIKYPISIGKDSLEDNKVTFSYKIVGLDIDATYKKDIYINKSILPNQIDINGVRYDTVNNGLEDDIFTNNTNDGYKMTVSSVPTAYGVNGNDVKEKILISYNEAFKVYDVNHIEMNADYTENNNKYYVIDSGDTVYVKFVDPKSESTELSIKTRISPEHFAGGEITSEYVTVSCMFTCKTTADSVTFYNDKECTEEITNTNPFLFGVGEGRTNLYVKAQYSIGNLDHSTLRITSSNPNVKFANVESTINLNYESIGKYEKNTDKYVIYTIPIMDTKEIAETTFTMTLDDGGLIGTTENSIRAKSVTLTTSEATFKANILNTTQDIMDVSEQVDNVHQNFAIIKSSNYSEMQITADDNTTNGIYAISLSNGDIGDISGENFGESTEMQYISDTTFQIRGIIANKTHIVKVSISYYTRDRDEGQIKSNSSDITLEFAVYEPIGYIVATVSSELSYVNKYFSQEAQITFYPRTSNHGTPTSVVYFSGEKSLSNVSTMSVSFNREDNFSYALKGGESLDNITELKNESKIIIKLTGEPSYGDIIATITAKRFDELSNISTNAPVNIRKVNKSKSIELTGKNIVTVGQNPSLTLSYMDKTNREDDDTIGVVIGYEDTEPNGVKFSDLAYELYRYGVDKDTGKVDTTKKTLVLNSEGLVGTDDIEIVITNGQVTINAKNNGGSYQLVLMTKDSYNDVDKVFTVTKSLDIRVDDGTKNYPYSIKNEEEFSYIKNDLTAYYELTNNIELGSGFGVIGASTGEGITPFTGGLYGNGYYITYTVDSLAESNNYGQIASLFGILGYDDTREVGAIINNIKLNVKFDNASFSGNEKGLVVGALAGVMLEGATIRNVEVYITDTDITLTSEGNAIYYGGLAGVNNATITASSVKYSEEIFINAKSTNTYIGGLVGKNTGNIYGGYKGKDDLKVISFDVFNNMTITTNDGKYQIGGVVGINSINTDTEKIGTISNMLVSGIIKTNQATDTESQGNLAGITGDTSGNITTVIALAVELESDVLDVAGIAGSANTNNCTIDDAKMVSVELEYDDNQFIRGTLVGSTVAGLVGNLTNNASIQYSSVESFVQDENFYTLTGDSVYGLAKGSGVSLSFVNANIKAKTKAYVTTDDETNENTYFIGKVDGYYEDKSTYSVIDGTASESYEITGEHWAIGNEINNINKVGEDYYPYIIRKNLEDNKYYPIMIIAPTEITIIINQKYVEGIHSTYIGGDNNGDENPDYNYTDKDNDKIVIKETVVVNYYEGADLSFNTHKLISGVDDDGLFNMTVLPTDASGAVMFDIVKGTSKAYINGNNIVFLSLSENSPIIIKCYSLFSPDLVTYVSIYTQYGISDLTLSSYRVSESVSSGYTYEMNLYSGDVAQKITVGAENIYVDEENNKTYSFDTILKKLSIEDKQLKLEVSETKENPEAASKVTIKQAGLNVELSAASDTYEVGANADVIFTLYLSNGYLGDYYTSEKNIELASVTLRVYLHNSATDISVKADHYDMYTDANLNLSVDLETGFVSDKNKDYGYECYSRDNGVLLLVNNTNKDSINIKINCLDADRENINTLLKNANVSNIIDLFDFSLISKKIAGGIGYDIKMSLVDNFDYRYIIESIELEIILTADSNASVTTKVSFTVKPATLNTVRIENYNVNSLSPATQYQNLIESDTIQTAIISPGGVGSIMMIYLEPAYANVTKAVLSSTKVNVPSLTKEVYLKYTQYVYDERIGDGAYISLFGNDVAASQDPDTTELNLSKVSKIDKDGKKIYTGIIYVHVQLERFSGYETTLTAKLNLTTENGTTEYEKNLLTTYLPEATLSYDGIKTHEEDGYLIEKGTYSNTANIKIYGYQFNSNPDISIQWNLLDGSVYEYSDETYKIINKIGDSDVKYLIGDYVSYYFDKNYNNVTYNATDGSYSMDMLFSVAEDIPASFTIGANLSLVTKDGQLTTSPTKTITFYPTNYIVENIDIVELSNNAYTVSVGGSKYFSLSFETNRENVDSTETLFNKLLNKNDDKEISNEEISNLLKYFTYENKTFQDKNENFSIQYSDKVNKYIITGVAPIVTNVKYDIYTYYYRNANGMINVQFVPQVDANKKSIPSVYSDVISSTFSLEIYSKTSEDNPLPIYQASDMFNSDGTTTLAEGQDYILMADIDLTDIDIEPIDVAIGSLDGNNKIIKIGGFKFDASKKTNSYYGLFSSIGTYTTKDSKTHETILKNVIVDYSSFENDTKLDGVFSLTKNEITNIVFGGLVAQNNGGLIYNCDVINSNVSKVKTINIIVDNSSDVTLTFGGLVGINNGIITNSRVGRDSYDRINPTLTGIGTKVEFGKLNFVLGNTTDELNNAFNVIAGGLVGNNAGTISSSYVDNTSLINYSTAENDTDFEIATSTNASNKTAGFVASNTGTISYSFVRGANKVDNYYTGSTIENKGNGAVAGFVYVNSGNVDNSFVNIELATQSSYIAGFVFNNKSSGNISTSYSACIMNSGLGNFDYSEQPFVGKNNEGETLSNGSLKNTYYYINSNSDIYTADTTKDRAYALNEYNFSDSDNLTGFVFVLSNVKNEREQGTWSYITPDNNKHNLPELMNASIISHSCRFLKVDGGIVEGDDGSKIYYYDEVVEYSEGTYNNPHIIRDVEEYENVFTPSKNDPDNTYVNEYTGYVRLINNINFKDTNTAIKTRTNYTLGDKNGGDITSIEGNGMTISGIHLDVDEAETTEEIGLFATIEYTYIKNLYLEYVTPTMDNQFSTTSVEYSGGLAGKINNSVVINLSLNGPNTILTGNNFVGGLAGIITGKSLIYGVDSNLSVKVGLTTAEEYLYHRGMTANDILHMSYGGGLAGVIDLEPRNNIEFNLSYINIYGNEMIDLRDKSESANIMANFAGGVAGYANVHTNAFKLKYYTGTTDMIIAEHAAGGLFGVYFGTLTASQVTMDEGIDVPTNSTALNQYKIDTKFGEYVLALESGAEASISTDGSLGNLSLIQSKKYAGGLVGVGAGANITASYAKVGISKGTNIGGIMGVDIVSSVTYSYAVPYVELNNDMKYVGGIMGVSYDTNNTDRYSSVSDYVSVVKDNYSKENRKITTLLFTFSTLLVDDDKLSTINEENTKLDYICPSHTYIETKTENGTETQETISTISANRYCYVGLVDYSTNKIAHSLDSYVSEKPLARLYDLDNSEQMIVFQDIFSAWSVVPYWSLNNLRYFPLLLNDEVSNFTIIDEANDFKELLRNPGGSYKITQNIDMSNWCEKDSNWIFDTNFTGVLIGEIEGSKDIPMVYNLHLKTEKSGTTGLFRQTTNATITNVHFVWGTSEPGNSAINIGSNDHDISYMAGLSCQDEYSLFSSVAVTTVSNYFTGSEKLSSKVQGFGGLIGTSYMTNIMGCTFAGNVNVTLDQYGTDTSLYFGGLVAYASANKTDGTEDVTSEDVVTMTISGSNVGVNYDYKRPNPENTGINIGGTLCATTTNFTIEVYSDLESYIGGAVGYADHIAMNAISVGNSLNQVKYSTETTYDYKRVDLTIYANNTTKSRFVGGAVGYASETSVSNTELLTDIAISRGSNGDNNTNAIGGLAGYYHVGNLSTVSGIHSSVVNTNVNLKGFSTTNASISGGVGMASGTVDIEQSLFTGNIDLTDANISNINLSGVVGSQITSEGSNTTNLTLQEVMSTVVMTNVTASSSMNVGGLVGKAEKLNILFSASAGRIVPTMSGDGLKYHIGGYVGSVKDIDMANSYSLCSIIVNNFNANTISNLYDTNNTKLANINALIGEWTGTTKEELTAHQVYYSSDFAMWAETHDIDNAYNLSAQTMSRDNSWHDDIKVTVDNQQSTVWTVLAKDNTKVPYISGLYYQLESMGYTSKDGYIDGTVFDPAVLNRDIEGDSKYTYYFLYADDYKDYSISALNGILIGLDQDITWTMPIVDTIMPGSAVSNIHVSLGDDSEKEINTKSIIAKTNNGMIYNSSVQGTGITVGAQLGTVVNENAGLVSGAYSSIEVVSTSANIGGIAYINNGTILSSYFTGYIDNGKNTAGGIAYYANEGLFYNCYMAGVITNVTDGNTSFANNKTINGINNYIDSLANIETVEQLDTDKNVVLKTVSTTELMNANSLKGSWHTIYSGTKMSTNANTFGYNYNYPILKINRLASKNGALQSIDKEHQLYTGTGKYTTPEEGKTRYDYLLGNGTNDYENAYKIPHLGVLSAVDTLVKNYKSVENKSLDLNYVFIYDIDGEYSENKDKSMISWTSVSNGTDSQFTGVVISNKYYTLTIGEELSDRVVNITNISNNGLFTNVVDSYFGDISLGNFEMNDSAPLVGLLKSGDNLINNVFYLDKSSIIANYGSVGALFGTVESNAKVSINNFQSTIGKDANSAILIQGAGSDISAGLIAGKSAGEVTIDGEENILAVGMDNIAIAGGLIGNMTGGSITIANKTENEYNTVRLAVVLDSEEFVSILGGIVGKTTDSASTISNVRVSVTSAVNGNNGDSYVQADTFGGLVGRVESKVNTSNCTFLEVNNSNGIRIVGSDDEKAIHHYGILAGAVASGSITADKFNSEVTVLEFSTKSYKIYGEEVGESQGVGVFVGYLSGGLTVTNTQGWKDITLKSFGMVNIGGVAGYYAGTGEEITIDDKPAEITLKGTTNVGGIFGYCAGALDMETFANSIFMKDKWTELTIGITKSDITNGYKATDPTSTKFTNIGGLFGVFAGTSSEEKEDGTTSKTSLALNEITNQNPITIEGVGQGINVGGIAGKYIGSTASGLKNSADIKYAENINPPIIDKDKEILNSGLCTMMNVGGIFGIVDAPEGSEEIVLTNLSNDKTVQGYQNVGGLVGSLLGNENVPATLSGSIELNEIKEGENTIIDNLVLKEDSSVSGGSVSQLDIEGDIIGDIIGVFNVGGAVGYASTNVTVSQIYSSANVYGNANVGGLIGIMDVDQNKNSNILNNYIGGSENNPLIVKGIYYNYSYELRGDPEPTINHYIPTNVGGLIGNVKNSTINHNIISNVDILTASESNPDGTVISTISNYIYHDGIGSSQTGSDDNKINGLIVINSNTKETSYSDIKTGIGGFAGSIDSTSIVNSVAEGGEMCDYMSGVDINASLGINVGTYYGYYDMKGNITLSNSPRSVVVPTLYGDTEVDGAYNVGGAVGYLVDNANADNVIGIRNTDFLGEAQIIMQSRLTGFYVGGLIGRLDANEVGQEDGDSTDILIQNVIKIDEESTGPIKNVRIYIDTTDPNQSYYMGGLVGKLVTSCNGFFSGSLGGNTKVDGYDKYNACVTIYPETNGQLTQGSESASNFGGLIGMLKVSKGTADAGVTIKGNHSYPFTVNTIENENYFDGESNYNVDSSSAGVVELYAQAYYINQDIFNIVGTKSAYWTENNPLNQYAKGWNKQYSGFRVLQRCIPQDNIGDSIAIVYDANNITHVMNAEECFHNKTSYEYTNAEGETLRKYTYEIEIGAKEISKFEWYREEKDHYYAAVDDDYIVYTIYADEVGSPKLYSRIGIAIPVLYTNRIYSQYTDFYKTDELLSNITNNTTQNYVYGYDEDNEKEKHLVKYRNGEEWITPKYDTNTATTVEKDDVEFEYITYINQITSYYDYSTTDHVILRCYVYDYLVGSDYAGDARFGIENNGVYFEYKTIYDTAPVDKDDSQLPVDGSIFNINGVTTWKFESTGFSLSALWNAYLNYLKIQAAIIAVIILIYLTKGMVLTQLGNILSIIIVGLSIALTVDGVLGMRYYANQLIRIDSSNIHFLTQEGQNFGLLGSMYSSDVYYEYVDGQLQMKSTVNDIYNSPDGNFYVAYSSERPSNYYTQDKIAILIEKTSGTFVDEEIYSGDIKQQEKSYLISSEDVKDDSYITLTFNDGSTLNAYWVNADTEDGTLKGYCLLSNAFIYHEGQYWIDIRAGDVADIPSQIFTGISGENMPNILLADDLYYVYGNYDRSNDRYMLGTGNHEYGDNHVLQDAGYYNGDGLRSEFSTASATIPLYQTQRLNYEPSDLSETDCEKYYNFGYGYMKGVYYTTNRSIGLEPDMYAVYTTSDSIPAEGKENIDYFVKSIDNEGIQEQVIYVLDNSSKNGLKKDKDSGLTYKHISEVTGTEETVYIHLYPYSFTESRYSVGTLANFYDETIMYTYTEDRGISHTAYYYYYDGGYKTNVVDGKNYVFTEIENEIIDNTNTFFGWIQALLPGGSDGVESTYSNATIEISNGSTSEVVSLLDIAKNWNKYKSYTYGENELSAVFDIVTKEDLNNNPNYEDDDYIIFIRSDVYGLGDDGLYTQVLDYSNLIDYDRITKGRYATNPTYNIYTKYKYILNGDDFNMYIDKGGMSIWEYNNGDTTNKNFYLIPFNENSTKPNIGYNTVFVERVKCTIGGGQSLTWYSNKGLGSDTPVTSGKINIQ